MILRDSGDNDYGWVVAMIAAAVDGEAWVDCTPRERSADCGEFLARTRREA